MELRDLIQKIHTDCFNLCKKSLGSYFPIAGNIAIFCQTEEAYNRFKKIQENITFPSTDINQKYYTLREFITFDAIENIPKTTYSHLYIRKPAPDSPEAGDVDFILSQEEYSELKILVSEGKIIGAQIYNRPGWDTIEIKNPEINAIAYLSTQKMAEKVRTHF